MRILIVGGLGYIGRALGAAALERGWEVHVTTRGRKRNHRFTVHNGVKSPEDLSQAVRPDVVYYMPGKPGGPYRSLLEVHYFLANKWLAYSARRSARFIYTSSIAVTADFSQNTDTAGRLVEEEEHLSGREPRTGQSYHSITKAMMERELVHGYSGKADFVIVRPGLVYGGRNPHSEWKILGALARLGIRVSSSLIPVIGVDCLARFMADLAVSDRFSGHWINAIEDASLEDAMKRVFGDCRRCVWLRVDKLLRLLRFAPRFAKSRLAYSLVRPGQRYGSRFENISCGSPRKGQ